MIDIRCACGEGYHGEESHIGRSLRCWRCGAILSIERGAPLYPRHPLGGEQVKPAATGEHPAQRATISISSSSHWKTGVMVGGAMIVLGAAILRLVGPWSKPSTKITLGPPPNTEQAASPAPTPLPDEIRGTHLFKPDEIPLIQREVLSPDYLPQSEAQKIERIRRVSPTFRGWGIQDQVDFVRHLDPRIVARQERIAARLKSAATPQSKAALPPSPITVAPPASAIPRNDAPFPTTEGAAKPIPLPMCARDQQVMRLPTGTKIESEEGVSGPCKLKIRNGTSHDAAVRIVNEASSRTARFVYIQAGDDYTLDGIEPGVYQIRWISGYDWEPACRDFLRESGYSEAGRTLWFKVEVDDYGRPVSATRHQVTLYPVLRGNLTKRTINRKRFFEGDQYVSPNP